MKSKFLASLERGPAMRKEILKVHAETLGFATDTGGRMGNHEHVCLKSDDVFLRDRLHLGQRKENRESLCCCGVHRGT